MECLQSLFLFLEVSVCLTLSILVAGKWIPYSLCQNGKQLLIHDKFSCCLKVLTSHEIANFYAVPC